MQWPNKKGQKESIDLQNTKQKTKDWAIILFCNLFPFIYIKEKKSVNSTLFVFVDMATPNLLYSSRINDFASFNVEISHIISYPTIT
jgi:hypothetical protein